MSEAPIEFIVAAFNEEKEADAALKELKAAKKEHLIGIQAAAVLRRDLKNKLHIKEVGELTGKKGALGGAVLGAAVGLLTGGTGLVLGAAGAVFGGLFGKKQDKGFDNDRLKVIGDSLKPGSSAILAVIEHTWVAELEQELEELGADVMTASIAADVAEQLSQNKDLTISALATEGAFTLERMAVGEDSAEISEMTVTDDAVMSGTAVATKDGIAYESTLSTAEGEAYEAGVITEDGAVAVSAVATEDGVAAEVVAIEADDEEK